MAEPARDSAPDQSARSRPAPPVAPGEMAVPPVAPTASDVFLDYVTSQVNAGDVSQMVGAQQHMLMRFEKTNEMLLNFNILSKTRFETTQHEFKKHTQLLAEMKADLDIVFKRIRILKATVSKKHPDAFTACSDVYNLVEDEEEEEEEEEDSPLTSTDLPPGGESPRLARQVTVIAANPAIIEQQTSTDSQTSSDPEPPSNQSSESDPQPALSHPNDPQALSLRRH